MGRGGYRQKQGASAPSGPGKFSKRDEHQKIATPNVNDSSDLEYGDRARLEAAQRTAPLPKAGTPNVAPRPVSLPARGQGGGLPSFLHDLPSGRPDEPGTAGMAMGPGDGPEVLRRQTPQDDDRQSVLDFLARAGNSDAQRQLSQVIDAQRPPEQPITLPQLNAPPSTDQGLGDGLPEEEAESPMQPEEDLDAM